MTNEDNPFKNLPGFKETIARIARVPAQGAGITSPDEVTYAIRDEANKITYLLKSSHRLSAADIRRALARAFTRTDAWPNEAGEVEIQI